MVMDNVNLESGTEKYESMYVVSELGKLSMNCIFAEIQRSEEQN
jgi:hypothetical protein